MKLFLTSTVFFDKEITKKVFQHIEKPIKDCKVLFIPNQKATKEKLATRKYLDMVIEWGFSESNIHIFNKFSPKDSENLDIDILTIGGGNTFETLKILRETKFDKEIINYVNNGVIYIGGSAGSHVVTSNIKHVEKYDENTCNLTDYKALNLFDGLLICHYTKERENDYLELQKSNKVFTLTDAECLIVENNKITKI